MELTVLEQKIIDKLSFGEIPTYRRLSISKEEFLTTLEKLESEDLLWFERIEEGVFKGESGEIHLKEKGRKLGKGFK
ncbi:hypothetical protein P7H55_00295 [Vagococcus lutrae]|uniref:hypothetical protein n=1 Tax=Vagococcus lutrae TaxID=81947 RepID=UPI0028925E66|nr:hypothetical protein [Vagococcus lutrae]MDT2816295.1 hypothetical protein [Vagococcus lutrae]